MNCLRDIPIKSKLTIISMLTASVAILLTCGAIVGFQMVNFRKSILKEVLTTASMIGENSAAALTFDDPASAKQTLKSLDADEHLVAAFIYNAVGKPFASYQPPGATELTPPPVRRNFHRFTNDWWALIKDGLTNEYLEVFREISVAGEPVGTVYLRHDMIELRRELERSAYLALTVMLVAALVALLLARKLLPMVAGPILDLGEVVREVAAHKDFSVRAVKQGNDEVGRLIDGFNEMLGQIQRRDSALQAAQDGLELRVVERTEELATSLGMLNATLESTADGILAVARSGKISCYNTKFAVMWGIPPDMLERLDNDEMIEFAASQVVDSTVFIRMVDEQFDTPRSEASEVIEMKDGRTFEHYVQSQEVGGNRVGVVINFRDVTLRKRADAELATASRQLLETSRQAGMAEVATSVLHNVGNVLNSVNVSCAVVADRVRKSRVGSVAKTADLLKAHTNDLSAYFMTDATGQKLPAYLERLAQQLADERTEVLRELKLLAKNIDHIKEIVAMQQNYAKVSGITDTLDVTELVDDSLRMNEDSLAKHGVLVIREYSKVPMIIVEKHKALQILVNLIRNAKHACNDSERADKQITLRISADHDGVRVAVTDNGVGILPENLTRIFAHGFTTKKDGHGFGLHSGALAAQEMGGRLTGHSAGIGTGATFTLGLPLRLHKPLATP